jgi:hypothetical protein
VIALRGLLLAALLAGCSNPFTPTPNDWNGFTQGVWRLTAVREYDGNGLSERPATATEARTWHVMEAEGFHGDTVRAPVKLEMAEQTGTGYWYLFAGGARIEVTLAGPGGVPQTSISSVGLSRGEGRLELLNLFGGAEVYELVVP